MMVLMVQSVLSACNPRQIKEQVNGTFSYPLDCHLDYGRLREVDDKRQDQVKHLEKSIKLKDLALENANDRIDTWKNATHELEVELVKEQRNSERLKWIYFGVGILTMGAATWAAGQLVR
jgi:hypothetical protein